VQLGEQEIFQATKNLWKKPGAYGGGKARGRKPRRGNPPSKKKKRRWGRGPSFWHNGRQKEGKWSKKL